MTTKIFFTVMLLPLYIFSQDKALGDIFIHNYASKNVWVRVYPVSMVFNVDLNVIGNYDFGMPSKKWTKN